MQPSPPRAQKPVAAAPPAAASALDGGDDLIRSGLAEAERVLTRAQRDALANAPRAVVAGAALTAAEDRANAQGPFAGRLPISPNITF